MILKIDFLKRFPDEHNSLFTLYSLRTRRKYEGEKGLFWPNMLWESTIHSKEIS